jgi:hypothetical protein
LYDSVKFKMKFILTVLKFCVMVYDDGFVIIIKDYKYSDVIIKLIIQC